MCGCGGSSNAPRGVTATERVTQQPGQPAAPGAPITGTKWAGPAGSTVSQDPK